MQDAAKKKKVALWLFTIPAVSYLIVETRGGIIHIMTEDWPKHALLHAVQSVMYTQALCLMVVILTWLPFRKGHRWSWWAIALCGITLHGAHIVGDSFTGGLTQVDAAQGSGLMFYAITIAASILYLVGLAITWRQGFFSDSKG